MFCDVVISFFVVIHFFPVSTEQRAFYEKHGYILIKNLVPPHRLNIYAQRFLDIVNGRVEKQATMLMMRDVTVAKPKGMGEHSITKLQDFMDDEVLFQYCAEPAVLSVVESIVGADVKAMHTMLINKPPDTGKGSSRHPPHQDLWYFPFRPAEKIVASWTAMQHIDETNGCLFVVPGSHMGQLLKHEYPSDGIVNKAYHGIQNTSEADTKSMVNIVMESGDTVFFHPLLIHGSGRNNSSGFRKAISCHFAACDCHYIDVKGSMQDGTHYVS
jgi:phytanoyl-CoA hydroxylase